MTIAAKFFIWSFFLLIVDQTLVIAGYKFGIPIKPAAFYAVFAVGLFVAGLTERGARPLADAKAFFLPLLALVILGVVMYRGEGTGPDFGERLLPLSQVPTSAGYALWPALNLIAAAGLYLLAPRHRQTIVLAAFVALVLQIAAMEADMWWPAIFGYPNGRAGGLAQNANVAALLVVVLASLTLPTRLGDRFNSYAPNAMALMVPAVLLSQSRAGVLVVVSCLLCSAVAAWKGTTRWPAPAFTVALLTVVGSTILLSPVLNRSSAETGGLSQFETRTANAAQSTALRREALTFFGDILKQNPQGIGTGFTNKFQTGPHNTFLKLAVDNGVLAAIGFAVMLAAATWQAVRQSNPMLLSICAAAWIASMFYHTLLVEPLIPVALAIGLGSMVQQRVRS